MDVLLSPLTWLAVAVAAGGSLFACRGLADRIWFTLVMPVVYGLLHFLCLLSIVTIAANLLPSSWGDSLSALAPLLSALICLGIFILQIHSMARDTPGGPHGYAIRSRRARHHALLETPELERIPTRKRWSG